MVKNPYHAYRKATHTVSKTRQVVMLYEGVLRNLRQARDAIEANHIEERYNKLVRASEIVLGLQMSLDFNSGEQAAQALYDFYASVDTRIMQLHRSHNLDLCDQIIADVRSMYEVWDKIDRGELNHSLLSQNVLADNGQQVPPASSEEDAPTAQSSPETPDRSSLTFSA